MAISSHDTDAGRHAADERRSPLDVQVMPDGTLTTR
jgi:hypothetical protein